MDYRKDYIDKLAAQLKDWDAEIERMRSKIENTEGDVQVKYQHELNELRDKKNAMQNKLNELIRSRDAAWEEIKSGVERGWKEMKDALDEARINFN